MSNAIAGHLLKNCLEAQGVERVFCVPGESYLAVLDALFDSPIETVVARHEGGAAIMAEADGKMTGRPGVCMVTRGPGATNAAAGVHIAAQDSTPIVLFVGQIARDMRGREAFQEMDYRAVFGSVAKWVEEIDRPERIPEIISHAWHVAMSGRPGPVVIALPEDMLRETVAVSPGPRVEVAEPAPTLGALEHLITRLEKAKSPMIVVGGSRWTKDACDMLRQFAEKWGLPVGVSFRRQQLFDANHPNYAGDVGLGINPELKDRVAGSDLLILLGCRFSENPSQGFSILDMPGNGKGLVHIHPGPEELGRIYVPEIAINATPTTFLSSMLEWDAKVNFQPEADEAHASYLKWTDLSPEGVGEVTMSNTISRLRDVLPDDAILCNGAGNYAIWLHRFYRYKWGTQLAPTSGSMGYGMPAAIAAAKRNPNKTIVVLAGDGCFQMTGQEFGVACEHGLNIKVIVCDNGVYGTIRMHQERDYPGRVSGTGMRNPDFKVWAKAYGAEAYSVWKDAEFENVLQRALEKQGPALIHLKLDARDIAPGRVIEA
ncbi:MAG: thiamine pyrophosphate-binding protein [Rhizobiaceae bacterium]|nr:thiamine pyrophosphate-binding protein [Rhizobiaceae bacterium]